MVVRLLLPSVKREKGEDEEEEEEKEEKELMVAPLLLSCILTCDEDKDESAAPAAALAALVMKARNSLALVSHSRKALAKSVPVIIIVALPLAPPFSSPA